MKHLMKIKQTSRLLMILLLMSCTALIAQSYKIVDTGQILFYDNMNEISTPAPGEAFYGQDANFSGQQPSYTDNGDGTVTDNVTGLMWQQSADLTGDGVINIEDKLSYTEALAGADTFSLADYNDWRLPSTKEAYSLFMFTGEDPSGYEGTDTEGLIPFINTDYFDIDYGDTDAGERLIDAQFASSTLYVGTTMNGDETMFGVNFVDGRIKGYPTGPMPGQSENKQFYVLYCRGNTAYGENQFVDNGDSTVSDLATGLMWEQGDSQIGMNWESALAWAASRNAENHLGYSDWRLPDAKELHSIVDYTRAPTITASAAIDPVFSATVIEDEGGGDNYASYWSSTTHANRQNGAWAAYICFGEALGFMPNPFPPFNVTLMDVHGAGAQRSDPKTGAADDYPEGHGPQGDVVRVANLIRLVRDIETTTGLMDDAPWLEQPESSALIRSYPNPFNPGTTIQYDLRQAGEITLTVFDMLGNEIVRLFQGFQSEGWHQIEFNGEGLSSGIYVIVVRSGVQVTSHKLNLLK